MKEIDRDQNNKITAKEMQIYLFKNGIDPKYDRNIFKILNKFDKNNDGAIDVKEFLA